MVTYCSKVCLKKDKAHKKKHCANLDKERKAKLLAESLSGADDEPPEDSETASSEEDLEELPALLEDQPPPSGELSVADPEEPDPQQVYVRAMQLFRGKPQENIPKDVPGAAAMLIENVKKHAHMDSTHHLGMMYLERMLPVDSQAMEWGGTRSEVAAALFQRAANMGHVDSLHNMGWLYSQGEGVVKDLPKAAQLFEQASERGHLESVHSLGLMYHQVTYHIEIDA